MSRVILIDGHAYQCITSRKITKINKLPSHPLEDGNLYTDHIQIGSPSFEVSLILFDGEYEILKTLSDEQKLFSIVLPEGSFSNVAVKGLTNGSNNSSNTTSATVTLQVQMVTSTEIKPSELDGITFETQNSSGIMSVPALKDAAALTVNQMKEYYLSKLGPMSRIIEREKLDNMTDREVLDYLTETQEELTMDGAMKAVKYSAMGLRQRLDIDEDFFKNANLYSKSFAFKYIGSDNIETSYTISIRKENPQLGKYTWLAAELTSALFGPAAMITQTSTGYLLSNIPYHYHIIITRIRDGAIMYNGPMLDLTAFEMVDPDTGIAIATLQFSEVYCKIFID